MSSKGRTNSKRMNVNNVKKIGSKKEIEEMTDELLNKIKQMDEITINDTPIVANKTINEFSDIYDMIDNDKTINYIVANNTFVNVVKVPTGTLIKSEEINFPFSKNEFKLTSHFKANEKIPVKYLFQTLLIFRRVSNKLNNTEVYVIICKRKSDGKIILYIPSQTVTGVTCSYTLESDWFDKYEPILNIHSHNRMKVSFSGTDDDNDKQLNYCSGIIKNIFDDPDPEIRIWTGSKFHNVSIFDIFDFSELDNALIPAEDILFSKLNKYDIIINRLGIKCPNFNMNCIKKEHFNNYSFNKNSSVNYKTKTNKNDNENDNKNDNEDYYNYYNYYNNDSYNEYVKDNKYDFTGQSKDVNDTLNKWFNKK